MYENWTNFLLLPKVSATLLPTLHEGSYCAIARYTKDDGSRLADKRRFSFESKKKFMLSMASFIAR